MSDERDPRLESIFAAAEQELVDEQFTSDIASRIASRRRRLIAGRLGVLALIVLLEVVLQSPLQQSLGAVADMLGQPLIPLEGGWIEFALEPVNTVAGLLGVLLVGVHLLMRKVLH